MKQEIILDSAKKPTTDAMKTASKRAVQKTAEATGINLSKTQLSKTIQSGGFLGILLGPLLKKVLPLENVIKPLAKIF